MVDGSPGAFMGGMHRMAAGLDGQIELICGAFSSDPAKSKAAGRELYLADERCACASRFPGFWIVPHSNASQTSFTFISPLLRSMLTSPHSNTRILLRTARKPHTDIPRNLLFPRVPIELLRSRLKHFSYARNLKVRKPELKRIRPGRRCKLVRHLNIFGTSLSVVVKCLGNPLFQGQGGFLHIPYQYG